MGSKARSKTVRRTSRRRKTRAMASTTSRSKKTRNVHLGDEGSLTLSETVHALAVKKCEEREVGDIGNFGSPDELENHEKRCGEPATQFCQTCGRNLCGSHYDLLHRDHDGAGHSAVSQAQ